MSLGLSGLPSALLYRFAIGCIEHAMRPVESRSVPLPSVPGVEPLLRAVAVRRAWLESADDGLLDAERQRASEAPDGPQLTAKSCDLSSLRRALLDSDPEACASATAQQCAELFGQRFFDHEGGGYFGIDCALAASLEETCWHYELLAQLKRKAR